MLPLSASYVLNVALQAALSREQAVPGHLAAIDLQSREKLVWAEIVEYTAREYFKNWANFSHISGRPRKIRTRNSFSGYGISPSSLPISCIGEIRLPIQVKAIKKSLLMRNTSKRWHAPTRSVAQWAVERLQ